MKICLVAPGIMIVPPDGWGAVEILIWDYFNELLKQGHDVNIVNKLRSNSQEQRNINSPYCKELIKEINDGNYDFVHVQYDCLFHILPYLTSKKIGITSHYPYIDQREKHAIDGYSDIFNFMVHNKQYLNLVLAEKDIEFLLANGSDKNYIHKLENGVDYDNFLFKSQGLHQNKTIYLGKISDRKGQHKYCNLNNIDIIGPGGDSLNNWKGSWTRNEVMANLTDYGNMLLLSTGEADPLVIKEAFASGLGVVVNKTSGKNLTPNDFITIIDDDKMDDMEYIQNAIDSNRIKSNTMRKQIRNFAEVRYGWSNVMSNYITKIMDFNLVRNTYFNNTTIVTAFFDINREKNGDGRKLNDYLSWIQKTLQLNCNMYIVTESKFVDFMKENRPNGYNTFIKEDTLENADYYKYLPKMTEILNSTEYKDKIAYPNRVECKLPEYNVIQYSKFGWLNDAIQNNPFKTDYFFWMDAGISRFFQNMNLSTQFPSLLKQQNVLNQIGNQFIIQQRQDLQRYTINDNFIWGADNLFKGGMFGGYKDIILEVKKEVERIFVNEMLDKNNVNNEQLALALLWKQNPDMFKVIPDINSHPCILLSVFS